MLGELASFVNAEWCKERGRMGIGVTGTEAIDPDF